MSRALVVINSTVERARAKALIDAAPWGTRVEFKAVKRSLPQSARMWAMLTDVARQRDWPPGSGVKWRADDWKMMFLASLKRELRMAPNLELDGYVNLGTSSRDLSKGEMSDLIETIAEFGARYGVKFGDQQEAAA